MRSTWVVLGCVGLCWVGLGWVVGLDGWVELGRMGSDRMGWVDKGWAGWGRVEWG